MQSGRHKDRPSLWAIFWLLLRLINLSSCAIPQRRPICVSGETRLPGDRAPRQALGPIWVCQFRTPASVALDQDENLPVAEP